ATPEETPSTPAPAVPEGQSSEAAADSEEEQERLERAALLEEHERLVSERQQLQQASARLQVRLGELLRPGQLQRRRAALGADGQQVYTQCLQQLRELQQRREQTAAASRERAAARRQYGEEREKLAQAEWAAFQSRKKEATVSGFGRQSRGRQAMELIQAKEWEQEQQLREARVENIRLKNEVKNLKSLLYAHGEEGEGQSLLDFEDVKKENQIYRKKINSLTNEVLKLKNKVSDTSHILNHFREKLQLVEAENERRKAELMEIEAVMSRKRDVLIKTKQARDKLWRSNFKLQQECGLLGYEILLRDFEEKMDTIGLLSKQLETLKRNHAALILTSKAIQKKIKEATSSFLV
ncbi:CCD96 protein, partial [Alcedo cyanopectus]|nr:CCD96 protein [Ceyx cyanopectus]